MRNSGFVKRFEKFCTQKPLRPLREKGFTPRRHVKPRLKTIPARKVAYV